MISEAASGNKTAIMDLPNIITLIYQKHVCDLYITNQIKLI